jgi:hypothetical protein
MAPGRRPVDLFRCESATLKSHWVMVVIDQFTRRIIGFAVHAGDCDGIVYCRMFNQIIAGKSLPKYLSSDNDPLFLFHRWEANLRILEIDELKSVPGVRHHIHSSSRSLEQSEENACTSLSFSTSWIWRGNSIIFRLTTMRTEFIRL